MVKLGPNSNLKSQNQTQTIVDLNKEITEKSETIEKLNEELSSLDEAHVACLEELRLKTEGVEKLNEHRTKLEEALSKSNEELESRSSSLQQLNSQRVRLEETLGKARYDLKMKDSELEDVKSRSSQLASKVEDLDSELADARTQSSQLMSKVEDIKTTSVRIAELQKLLNKREEEDQQVVDELRTLREQYAEAYSRQQELQVQLAEATNYRESMENEFGQHGTEIRLLKMKLKASEETIRKLRRERAGVLARLANYRTIAEPDATVISFTQALALRERQTTQYDSEYGGRTSHHEKRGVIYTEAPTTKDDLKRISGIAEVLEGRLNDYGIYTFKQVMDWEPEAVEEFSRLLAFKDRIERDDWRSQARYFYNEKKSGKQAVA